MHLDKDVDYGVLDIEDLENGDINDQEMWGVLYKKYTCLLTYEIWELSEF